MPALFAADGDAKYERTYPLSGFNAYSDNSEALPDDIYMTSMCIMTECAGYVPCAVFKFDDENNRKNRLYNVYIVRASGEVKALYHIYDAGSYIADYELLEGEKYLLSAKDGSADIYIEGSGEIFRVKANEDEIKFREYKSGYYACSATGDILPDDIEPIQLCIRGNCSGPVTCAMMKFSNWDKVAAMEYECYVVRPTGTQSDGFMVTEQGLIISDEVLSDTACLILRSADKMHELYICLSATAIKENIPFKL